MAMYFDPFREFDRVASALLDNRQGPRLMPVDLYRDGDHYTLHVDLPGVDPKSIDIDVDGQQLSIRAERARTDKEDVKWIAHERPAGSFLRQFTLGDGIDTEKISADYVNGVLAIRIPVSEKAKPRKVEVTSGGSQQELTAA